MHMDDSVSSVNTKLEPSSLRCFLSSFKVLNDTTAGCGFSRTVSKSSFSCCGREEFALANNCLAFSWNLTPTSKAVAIVSVSSNPVRSDDRFQAMYRSKIFTLFNKQSISWSYDQHTMCRKFVKNLLTSIYLYRSIVPYSNRKEEKLRGQPYWLPCDTVTYNHVTDNINYVYLKCNSNLSELFVEIKTVYTVCTFLTWLQFNDNVL